MNLCEDVFVGMGAEEVSPADFYRGVFGKSRGYVRYGDDLEVPVTLSSEAGGTWRSVKLSRLSEISEGRNDAYVSPCTYFPKKSSDGSWHSSNGKRCMDEICAFVVDLDHVDPDVPSLLFEDIPDAPGWFEGVPAPTYAVCSGKGLHLYFVLEQPVPALKRWMLELEQVNRKLYELFAVPALPAGFEDLETGEVFLLDARIGDVDYHGVSQPYRVVGSFPKSGSDPVSAWRVGNTVSIEDLARFAGLDETVWDADEFDMSESLLSKASGSNPNWAREKKTSRKGWTPGFYRWLAQREKDHARLYGEYGHRYKQVQALSIAAIKDGIPRAQLEEDVRDLYKRWNACSAKYGHPRIEWAECRKAMNSFDPVRSGYRKFPKWWLEGLCGWEFGTQKRNGRSQAEHLAKVARPIRFYRKQAGDESVVGGGRPKGSGTKTDAVRSFAAAHPDANHSEIARALGVSRPTVIKWLKAEREGDDGR